MYPWYIRWWSVGAFRQLILSVAILGALVYWAWTPQLTQALILSYAMGYGGRRTKYWRYLFWLAYAPLVSFLLLRGTWDSVVGWIFVGFLLYCVAGMASQCDWCKRSFGKHRPSCRFSESSLRYSHAEASYHGSLAESARRRQDNARGR
jgi:hypothetical protein